MELPEELRKLTQNLTVQEKRFITLQGKSRSGTDSQLFKLFDWLNRAGSDDAFPKKAAFARNLPTLAARLRALMLDSLYLMHKESDTEMQLNSMLSEIHLLQSRKLMNTAARQLKKAKKLAYDFSRYAHVLRLIQNETIQAQKLPVDQFELRLEELVSEEQTVTTKLQRLNSLQQIHNRLLIMLRKYPFSLEPAIVRQASELAGDAIVEESLNADAFLEHALAVSILGIRDMFARDPDASVPRYQKLIRRWQKLPAWQKDQPQLLLTICKHYQNACIFSPVDHTKISADLAFLEGFRGLPKEDLIVLQDLLYSNQFAMAINTGRVDVVIPMISEIEQWIRKGGSMLTENQVYPYYCNFAVAEFISGNYAAANRQINRLIREHNRKARLDIYEFAITMRTVLMFELNDHSLGDHLIRSGKRHFQKNKIVADFELMVIRYMSELLDHDSARGRKVIYKSLRESLEKFAATLPATIPLLGLNEIAIWAESKESGIPIEKLYIRRVEENMRMLEGMKKTGE